MLRPRATGIMDYLSGAIEEFRNPVPERTDPRTMIPMGQGMGPVPPMMPTAQRMTSMNAPQATTPQAPFRAGGGTIRKSPTMGLGQGVRMTPEQLEEQAFKAAKIQQERPDIAAEPGFMKTVTDFFGDRENMLRLAAGFNSMRLQPDQGLATVISSELQDIRERRAGETQRSRTAEFFDKEDPKIAAAIRAGLDPKSAIAVFRDKQKGVVVGKMIVNPTTGAVIYDGSKEGSDLPDSVQKLIFQAKEAGLQPGTAEYREFMARGGKSKGLSMRMNADGTFEFSETGDLASLTEGQGKATLFGTRMSEAQDIINTVENEGTSIYNAIVGNVPFVGNLATSNEFKVYNQAKQDFINAILRFESGAAIGQNEFDRADAQYFPQPGDTPQVIANKRRNRDIAIAAMSAVSGPSAAQYSERIRQEIYGDRAKDFPKVGTVKDGYRYIGGDPAIETNWVKVQ